MIIPYSRLPDFTTKVVFAPLIPVTFQNGIYEFPTFALVDSGATNAVISTTIAEALNINWRKTTKLKGLSIGGPFRSYSIDGLLANIYNHEFKLSVGIIERTSPYQCILGQNDLFQKAKIIFERYKNQFEIIFREYD